MKDFIITTNDFLVFLLGAAFIIAIFKGCGYILPFYLPHEMVSIVSTICSVAAFLIFCLFSGFWFVLSGIYNTLLLTNIKLDEQNRLLKNSMKTENIKFNLE